MANKSPYQQPLNDLYAAYHSSREGLSTAQANQNREQFGKNQLAQKKKKPVWMIFLEQFKDFLVIILIIAAIISAITGELESTIVILVVITMNAILGTVQTVKAEKSLDNLKSLSAPHAKVLRDGSQQQNWSLVMSFCWRLATKFRQMLVFWRLHRCRPMKVH